MDLTDPLRGLSEEVREKLARIRLFVLDVDGTLTDGRVQAHELDQPRFDVHDGQGLNWVRRVAGVQVAWISGRGARATWLRGRELGVDHLRLRVGPKGPALEALFDLTGCSAAETLSMGDDLPDLALASRSALFAAPADARPEVRARADLVSTAGGGRGAVRQVCEQLLAAQGQWAGIVEAAGR